MELSRWIYKILPHNRPGFHAHHPRTTTHCSQASRKRYRFEPQSPDVSHAYQILQIIKAQVFISSTKTLISRILASSNFKYDSRGGHCTTPYNSSLSCGRLEDPSNCRTGIETVHFINFALDLSACWCVHGFYTSPIKSTNNEGNAFASRRDIAIRPHPQRLLCRFLGSSGDNQVQLGFHVQRFR